MNWDEINLGPDQVWNFECLLTWDTPPGDRKGVFCFQIDSFFNNQYKVFMEGSKLKVHSSLQWSHIPTSDGGTVVSEYHTAKYMHSSMGAHQLVTEFPI